MPAPAGKLTAQRARELLSYDPETGTLTWKVSRSRVRAGAQAGNLDHNGYVRVRIDGVGYLAHRVAWLIVHGSCPDLLDHKNGNRLDNRLQNLRPASPRLNQANRRIAKNNTSGVKGIIKEKGRTKWRARIRFHGKLLHLGAFDTKEEAAAAYASNAQRYFGEFARSS